ncbi:nephrin-like [Limulus polyphemus]|uniref:Nephrin-like n=1 Tax=Limulus polyphemus TaxID=6850 RepID=A0ABM1S5F0_LIMPO|nr:nephrin-like [Limulus polyphemus]
MNLRPIEVKIISPQRPLLAREKTQIACQSFGSRPAANIHWWKDRKKLTSFATMVKEKNYTISELTFIPEIEDNGRYLSCEADNPLLTNRGLEDGWILNVHYDPQVTLKLGSNIQLETIAEGNDVYFECHVQANPWVDDIIWLHEGIPIRNKQEEGIIISNQSLVLQHIKITSRGKYQCIAYNSQGSGRSNKIEISLKYIPVCCDHREQVYRLAKNESAIISCCVDSNPRNVDFFWTLNNSQEMVNIHSFYVNKTTSVLTYRPRSEIDYGILLCWAKNDVGEQREPCIFNIISVGRPASLQNCILFNITARGFAVRCKEGYDGGLNQTFHLEIYSSLKEKIFLNLTQNKSPAFLATNLPPSTSFIVTIYASNSKGRSNLVVLTASTTLATQELKGDPKTTTISPTLAIVIGVVGTLIVLAVAVLIFSRCRRCRKSAGHEKDKPQKTQSCPQENIDPNFTSKIRSEAITTPTELSLGNGNIPRRREIDTFYGLEMDDLPTHNINPIFKGESSNLEYPLDMCDTSGWSTTVSSV